VHKIRPALIDDISSIFELMRHSVCGLCKEHYSESKLESYLSQFPGEKAFNLIMKDHICIVATLNTTTEANKLVGFARFDPAEQTIAGLFVLPGFTRQGVGSSLLSYIEDVARSLSKEMLCVKAPLNSIPFYQTHEYEQQDNVQLNCDGQTSIECVNFYKNLM